ncbi:hypothetical protein V4D10_18390, partial [Vibrio mimicus]|uniref:hypothetical protein n=1 Tax=Vibrio mimicus TaxID=674 RepID=UPI002F926BAF
LLPMNTTLSSLFLDKTNARLRGWQRITPNSNTTTSTTAAHWDWKRHALTVPLEAFVMFSLPYCACFQ